MVSTHRVQVKGPKIPIIISISMTYGEHIKSFLIYIPPTLQWLGRPTRTIPSSSSVSVPFSLPSTLE